MEHRVEHVAHPRRPGRPGRRLVEQPHRRCPAAKRRGDVGAGHVGAGLGALGAAGEARTQVDAGRAPLVLARGDGAVRRPPVPTEPVEATRQHVPELAEGPKRNRVLFVLAQSYSLRVVIAALIVREPQGP